jgi:heme-binding protein
MTLKSIIASIVAVAMGLQLAGPSHSNPPFDESTSLERTTDVPADVARTFAVACNDCHSNKTHWRWYTYVAPVSWLTVGHVTRGRAELNFSVWGTYGSRMRETRLRRICGLSREGAMPLPSYTLVHPSAKLSPDQIAAICEWTGKTDSFVSSDGRARIANR